MATKKKQRPRRASTKRAPETVTLELETVYDLLDLLGYEIRQIEGPFEDARGRLGWWDEQWDGVIEFATSLETKLKTILKQRELDQAVAKALVARGIESAELVSLAGGKGRR